MEKYSEKYKDFLYENLDDKFKDKLDEKYISIKRGILLLLEESVEDVNELVNIQNYMHKSIEDLDSNPLIGFIDDGDIFDFYLKYQLDIDDICNNNSWFKKQPIEENIFSLYQYIINGTKFGVQMCMKIMEKEMFK